jgi:four helix bundle protein
MQDYHRLLVWEKAHALTLDVFRASRSFRRSGCVALRTQLVRAAESVPENIVEGCYAATPKEFARFLDISIKSTGEVEYQLELARDYRVLSQELHTRLTAATVEVRKMLVVLRRKVLGEQ